MDTQEFLLRYSEGKKYFYDVNLQGANLSGMNLSRISLVGANLTDANLTNANLVNANLELSILNGAIFTKANLTGVNFKDASLLRVNFSLANLTGVNFNNLFLGGTNFSKANLKKANFDDANRWLAIIHIPNSREWEDYFRENVDLLSEPINFNGSDLGEASFKGAYFSGSNFSGTYLYCANLQEASLSKCNFRKACLDETIFVAANLNESDFRESSLIDSNFTGANLSEANLSGVIVGVITHVNEYRDYYSRACFIRANLQRANLKEADLRGSVFVGADLSSCDFSNATLTHADLSESNISGALFNKARLKGYGYSSSCKLYKAYFYENNKPTGINLDFLESMKIDFSNIPEPYKIEIIHDRQESRMVLMEALKEASNRLILVSPWLSKPAIDSEVLQKLQRLLIRGCHIDIGWGFSSDIYKIKNNIRLEEWKYNALPDLKKIEKEYSSQFQLKLIGTHEKYLVCDNSFTMLGSHNFLTSGDKSDEREVGIRTDNPETIKGLIRRFDNAPNLDPYNVSNL